jgi:methionyl-tRNA formyltransferase
MKIVFMGTPDFAVPPLLRLQQEHEILCVYTQPPRPAGRGQQLRQSPVHDRARRLGLAVRTPASLRSEDAAEALRALGADVLVVVAYGLILPPACLNAARHGALNIHASLLPRWRGAAPIHRAILAGDGETGVGIMRMEAGLDTGPVLTEARTAIGATETTGDLHDRLSEIGADLIAEVLQGVPGPGRPQATAGVTYATKIDKSEARIDWSRPVAVSRGLDARRRRAGEISPLGRCCRWQRRDRRTGYGRRRTDRHLRQGCGPGDRGATGRPQAAVGHSPSAGLDTSRSPGVRRNFAAQQKWPSARAMLRRKRSACLTQSFEISA